MNRALGQQGERVAEFFLEKKGYTILETNFHAQGGEIDIVCKNSAGKFVFVEVKTRSSDAFGSGKEAVSAKKFLKISQAIEAYFLKKMEMSEFPEFQIDVISIRKSGHKFFCEHIQNIGIDDF